MPAAGSPLGPGPDTSDSGTVREGCLAAGFRAPASIGSGRTILTAARNPGGASGAPPIGADERSLTRRVRHFTPCREQPPTGRGRPHAYACVSCAASPGRVDSPETVGAVRHSAVMATTTCGWCNRDVHMTQLSRHPSVQNDMFTGYVSDAAYKCDNCGRFSVVTWRTTYDPSDSYRSGEPEDYDRSVQWNPPATNQPGYPDVPSHIASAAREAWLCFAHNAYIATCSVARSVIESSAKAHGVTVYGIHAKITELSDKHLIWGTLVDSAHIVRQFGNDAAHGDLAEPATNDEASDVLTIMDELLHQLFTTPARAAKLKAARAARKD